MHLYSLLDKKAGVFGGVLMAMNDGHMSRFLQERFGGGTDTVAKYPEDFDLYFLGSMDERTGNIEPKVVFTVNLAVILPQKEA